MGAGDPADEGTDPTDGSPFDESAVRERLEALVERARDDRRSFEPPADPPDEERARRYLEDGAGQAIVLYVHARTGGRFVHFSPEEFAALESAMNTWLELYAFCYGYEIDAECSLREGAELMIEIHNVRDVARILTGVPDRHER